MCEKFCWAEICLIWFLSFLCVFVCFCPQTMPVIVLGFGHILLNVSDTSMTCYVQNGWIPQHTPKNTTAIWHMPRANRTWKTYCLTESLVPTRCLFSLSWLGRATKRNNPNTSAFSLIWNVATAALGLYISAPAVSSARSQGTGNRAPCRNPVMSCCFCPVVSHIPCCGPGWVTGPRLLWRGQKCRSPSEWHCAGSTAMDRGKCVCVLQGEGRIENRNSAALWLAEDDELLVLGLATL